MALCFKLLMRPDTWDLDTFSLDLEANFVLLLHNPLSYSSTDHEIIAVIETQLSFIGNIIRPFLLTEDRLEIHYRR